MLQSGTSETTTLPAPTIQWAPTFAITTAAFPIQLSVPIRIRSKWCGCRRMGRSSRATPCWLYPLRRCTPLPMSTFASISTSPTVQYAPRYTVVTYRHLWLVEQRSTHHESTYRITHHVRRLCNGSSRTSPPRLDSIACGAAFDTLQAEAFLAFGGFAATVRSACTDQLDRIGMCGASPTRRCSELSSCGKAPSVGDHWNETGDHGTQSWDICHGTVKEERHLYHPLGHPERASGW